MTKPFADHFQSVARDYAENRPTYPDALFAWLAQQCAERGCAWDCGTGSGQAAVALASHFRRVIGTDASAAQIAAAQEHPGVEYRVAPAESSGLEDASVDLVVVAQALHWFDLDRFYAEVRRVLKPDGLIAVWTYAATEIEGEAADRLLQHFYRDVVGPYWPPERRHVENGYRDLPFPFAPIASPPFVMSVAWDLERLLGYLRSWSATARFVAAQGRDPVDDLATSLRHAWGDPATVRRISWRLAVRAGRPLP